MINNEKTNLEEIRPHNLKTSVTKKPAADPPKPTEVGKSNNREPITILPHPPADYWYR